jgi:long-chain acyl-CoA synthetase
VNLAAILDDTALRHDERTALKAGRRATSYGELRRASIRAAALLARVGVEPGDRVGLVLPNVPEFAAAYYGILRAGAIAVPLSPASTRTEIEGLMADVEARCVLAWRGLPGGPRTSREARMPMLAVAPGSFYDIPGAAPVLGRLAERAPGDTAAILYTSSTSGRAKGVELTHDNLVRNARATAGLFSYDVHDAVLGALPLFHCFGQTCVLNAAVLAGASVVLVERFSAAAVDRLLRDGAVSVMVGMPSMLAAIVAAGAPAAPCRRLRLGVSGGAPLRPEVMVEFERRFGCTVLEGYGLTETSPVAAFNRPGMRRPGTIGTPIEGVDMRLGPGGEILVRGHNVMKGYWRRPDETAAVLTDGGWLRTGDLGRVDADGVFSVVGRVSDLIIRDGHNIAPAEIEAVLCAHPAVLEAAVVGLADPIRGEEVLACAALRPRARAGEAELLAHLRASLAGDKQPRELWIVDELPKGPTGKVVKSAIAIPERIRLALAGARSAA